MPQLAWRVAVLEEPFDLGDAGIPVLVGVALAPDGETKVENPLRGPTWRCTSQRSISSETSPKSQIGSLESVKEQYRLILDILIVLC
jgi:hypothetical protein